MKGIKRPTDVIYNKTKEPLIGGPGTVLPFVVESFLGWLLAVACLSVSGYHYILATVVRPILNRIRSVLALSKDLLSNKRMKKKVIVPSASVQLPLTIHSRSEIARLAPSERCCQLISYLQHLTKKKGGWSNQELVDTIRKSDQARRLASLAVTPDNKTSSSSVEDSNHQQYRSMRHQLEEVWTELLRLPEPSQRSDFAFDISMIVPAYRERGTDVRRKLKRALTSCSDPQRVEVVIVDAGECIGLRQELKHIGGAWGSFRVVDFIDGGGRGPCLNHGAKEATGRLYTFCHSDTTLPPEWDTKVIKALDDQPNGVRANSCAFSFGIDTSATGLNGGPYPPGIKAVETTANIRTQLYSLPYGDQVLSVPAVVFDFLGGYPDQCLMEDYELISLLRRRAALLPKLGIADRERLVIIGGTPALCSPRRWQKFGVLFVTYMNSKFVNLYAGGLSADGLFQLYYGRPAPKRRNSVSPWENEVEKVVN